MASRAADSATFIASGTSSNIWRARCGRCRTCSRRGRAKECRSLCPASTMTMQMAGSQPGHRYPESGRNCVAYPLRSNFVRLVFGHLRKNEPCVQLLERGEGVVTVVATVGTDFREVMKMNEDGFCSEWLDVPVSENLAVNIHLSMFVADTWIGAAVVTGSEMVGRQGSLRKPLLGVHGVGGELVLDFLVMTTVAKAAQAMPEKGITDIPAPHLVGHRGSGARGTSPYKENTVISFIAATRTAAVSHVELDVQLTREGTPVVYHDFHIEPRSKGRRKHCAIPIYNLPVGEFAGLQPPTLFDEDEYGSEDETTGFRRSKGLNLNTTMKEPAIFEGYIRDVLPTLSQVCQQEYQVRWNLPFPSRDFFANQVLDVLFNEAKNETRSIIFSTFDADLALLLKAKQWRYPVYFLCAEDKEDLVDQFDSRCVVAEDAIDFAKTVHLDGTVFSTEVLLAKRNLPTMSKGKGLAIMTYGGNNSDPEVVETQFAIGVDGVIADNVNLLVTQLNMDKHPIRVQPLSDVFYKRCTAPSSKAVNDESFGPSTVPIEDLSS